MFIRQKVRYRIGFLLLSFLFYGLVADCAAQMISIDTRPGVTVRVLMVAPTDPKGIFLLFPGGLGLLAGKRGQVTGSFPRFPDFFAEQGFVAALIDVPSDRPDGTGRSSGSARHTQKMPGKSSIS